MESFTFSKHEYFRVALFGNLAISRGNEKKCVLDHRSVSQPFLGDYVQLRRQSAYKEALKKGGLYKMDRRLVFANEASKANRSNGKVRWIESGWCIGVTSVDDD